MKRSRFQEAAQFGRIDSGPVIIIPAFGVVTASGEEVGILYRRSCERSIVAVKDRGSAVDVVCVALHQGSGGVRDLRDAAEVVAVVIVDVPVALHGEGLVDAAAVTGLEFVDALNGCDFTSQLNNIQRVAWYNPLNIIGGSNSTRFNPLFIRHFNF